MKILFSIGILSPYKKARALPLASHGETLFTKAIYLINRRAKNINSKATLTK